MKLSLILKAKDDVTRCVWLGLPPAVRHRLVRDGFGAASGSISLGDIVRAVGALS